MKIRNSHALVLMFVSQAVIGEVSSQPVQSIENAISVYVKSSLDGNGRYEIDATPLDPHLQLPLCDQTLQVFSQAGELKAGHNTVGVRCNGSKNWMIYNVVSIRSYKDILVLSKPLRRNEVIRSEYLISENREISNLPQGYIDDPAEIVNKQAARNLPAGSVLNRLSYQELTLVKRGERVNIQSGNAGISITAAGTALMDGAKGVKINVKNLSSQKVIQAVVVDSGQVTVNF